MSAARERAAFLAALEANPLDDVTRLVFADWLEEHDEPEEADRMRAWRKAHDWLKEFARRINRAAWNDEKEDYELDEHGQKIYRDADPHTYEDVIEAGHDALAGKVFCFGTDEAIDFFTGWADKKYDPDLAARNRAEFFHNWSIVTGVPVPAKVIEKPPFRCAC